jgi:hypothetical protein
MPRETQQIDHLRHGGQDHAQAVTPFDYAAAAELFAGPRGRSVFTYKRFESAAEALRFAIEEAPAQAMLTACLQIDEARFDFSQIRLLYANARYPLRRRADVGAEPKDVTRIKAAGKKIQRARSNDALSRQSPGM